MSKTQKELFLQHLNDQINDKDSPETILAYLEIVLPTEGRHRAELEAIKNLYRDSNQQSDVYKLLEDFQKTLKEIEAKGLNLEYFDFESQDIKDRRQRLFRIFLAIIGIVGAMLSGWVGTIIKDQYENKAYQFCLELEDEEDRVLWNRIYIGSITQINVFKHGYQTLDTTITIPDDTTKWGIKLPLKKQQKSVIYFEGEIEGPESLSDINIRIEDLPKEEFHPGEDGNFYFEILEEKLSKKIKQSNALDLTFYHRNEISRLD